MNLDAYIIVPIVILCFVVGYVIKNSAIFGNVANQNIPLIVTVVGAVFGLLMVGLTPEGFIMGSVSGLASTGVHQFSAQLFEIKAGKEAENDNALEFNEPVEGDEDE